MASKNKSRRLSLDTRTSNDRGPAKGQRPTDRALRRAGTGGSGDSDRASILLWSLVFVVVAVVVVGVTLIASNAKGNSTGSTNVVAPSVVTPSNVMATGRTLGNPSAAVTVDLYGDFRCSACYGFTTGGTEQSLVANYVATNKVKLVWHDYLSIDKIQGNNNASRDAANAAWCATDQGKFWVMHDWLYANDGAGSEDPSLFTAARLSAIGKAAGLDMSTFQTCLDRGSHLADIAAEDQATPAAVTGTPTLYVNGKLVGTSGYVPTYDQIKAAIDSLG
jgi:protein-disulfide isomerase